MNGFVGCKMCNRFGLVIRKLPPQKFNSPSNKVIIKVNLACNVLLMNAALKPWILRMAKY